MIYSYARAKELTKKLVSLQIPVLLNGGSGIGKTALVNEVALELGLPLIDVRLAHELPENVGGIPKVLENSSFFEKVLNVDFVPLFTSGAVLFFDELNRSHSWTRNSVMSVFFERLLGGKKLAPNTVVVGAVNTGEEYKDADSLDFAMLARFAVINLEPSVDDLVAYFKKKYPLASALFIPKADQIYNLLHLFYEKVSPVATPRTVEYALKIIETYHNTEDRETLRDLVYCVLPGNVADLLLSEIDFTLIKKIINGEKVSLEEIENPTILLAVLSNYPFENGQQLLNAILFAKKAYKSLEVEDTFVGFLKNVARNNPKLFTDIYPTVEKEIPSLSEFLSSF